MIQNVSSSSDAGSNHNHTTPDARGEPSRIACGEPSRTTRAKRSRIGGGAPSRIASNQPGRTARGEDSRTARPKRAEESSPQPLHAPAQLLSLTAIAIESPAQPPATPDLHLAETMALEAAELSLTPQQQTALLYLSAGSTRAQAAHAAGVSRSTLHRWTKNDAAFIVAMNTWENDLVATARTRLATGLRDATETVLRDVRTNSKLAYKLLTDAGATTPRGGTMDLHSLKFQIQLQERKMRLAQQRAEEDLEDEEFLG